MSYTQIDADIAAFDGIDGYLDDVISKFDTAVETIDRISQFGITKVDFDSLQSLYPELTLPEFTLSANPVRLGADNIGNEALTGLSTVVTVGILTALAAVLGWVLKKLFGGSSGSSGGSGGGGGFSSAHNLAEAKLPFVAKVMIESLEQEIKAKGAPANSKTSNTLNAKIGKIKSAALTIEAVNSGAVSGDVKAIHDMVKDVVDLIVNDADDSIIISLTGKSIPGIYNKMVGESPFYGKDRATRLLMTTGADLPAIAKARAEEVKIKPEHFDPYFSQYTGKYPEEVDINISRLAQVETSTLKLKSDIESMIVKLEKTSPQGGSADKRSAMNNTLKIVLNYIKRNMIPLIANSAASTDMMATNVLSTVKYLVGIYNAIPEDSVKESILKDAGLTTDDVKGLISGLDAKRLKAIETATSLLTSMTKSITITDVQQAKINTLMELSK